MIVSVMHVSAAGGISLVAANVPFTNLQWTRRMASVGEFSISLVGRFPADWPGRYLLTRDDAEEVGVIEKVVADEGSHGESCQVSGRFAECFFARYAFGAAGAEAVGANWRQAVTAAMRAWVMPDAPRMAMGAGTEAATGSSYALRGEKGSDGAEAIYSACESNGARPLVTYDRERDPDRLVCEIRVGADRTRAQDELPVQLFALSMGNISSASYTGDYSAARSVVMAHAEKGGGSDAVSADAEVAVPGFDPDTQWRASAFEDVSSLVDDSVRREDVVAAANLRALGHRPSIAIDGTVSGQGYKADWDLGDLCEAEMPSIGLAAAEHVQEVREVAKADGVTAEATLGTKSISRLARVLMGRR